MGAPFGKRALALPFKTKMANILRKCKKSQSCWFPFAMLIGRFRGDMNYTSPTHDSLALITIELKTGTKYGDLQRPSFLSGDSAFSCIEVLLTLENMKISTSNMAFY